MSLNNTGYDSTVEETLAECQGICLDDYPICVAVDYNDGLCMMFNIKEYRSMTLIKNVGNIHSTLKTCVANGL